MQSIYDSAGQHRLTKDNTARREEDRTEGASTAIRQMDSRCRQVRLNIISMRNRHSDAPDQIIQLKPPISYHVIPGPQLDKSRNGDRRKTTESEKFMIGIFQKLG